MLTETLSVVWIGIVLAGAIVLIQRDCDVVMPASLVGKVQQGVATLDQAGVCWLCGN